ncbi:MAG: hypothetical protein ACLQJ0_00690 [Steroidobacteraceae bacterium]
MATEPLQPPDAVHAAASIELQVSVAVPPVATVVGEADKLTEGARAVTTTSVDSEADPPGPEQVST